MSETDRYNVCMNFQNFSHTRYNPLTGENVLVSPHRTKRPWQGKVEEPQPLETISYDPGCYLCPGNERAGGKKNPEYTDTFVFDNDFAALLPAVPDLGDMPSANPKAEDLFRAEGERGKCRVICFSPKHNVTLALMDPEAIEKVIHVWIEEYKNLGNQDFIRYVQIFENRGAVMGCSNPHPHCQIWANEHIPVLPGKEQAYQRRHYEKHGSCLLCDYLSEEISRGDRIVFENAHFAALVPFWAVWPFETMVLPKDHLRSIDEMNSSQARGLADALHRMSIRFDNLFSASFPYSMGIHQQPADNGSHDSWHFHIHYYPPLLRSAAVRKFMVGYELLANPQRDITAEKSAKMLRDCSEIHYSEKNKGDLRG